jgi:hypothetical protein
MEVFWAHESMVRWAVMLGVEIGFVGVAWPPVNKELFLRGTVFDPMESHVDCFRSFLLDGVISKTRSCGVVNLHGCAGLRVPHLF